MSMVTKHRACHTAQLGWCRAEKRVQIGQTRSRSRRTLVGRVSLNDDGVRSGLERHHDARLEPAGIVDVGEFGAGRLKVVARVQPEPGVVVGATTCREGVLPGGGDREPVEVLPRGRTHDVGSAGGVAGEGAPAG